MSKNRRISESPEAYGGPKRAGEDGKSAALQKAASILLALLVWEAASFFAGSEFLLAPPHRVAARLVGLITEKDFISASAFSLIRIVSGFMLALLSGLALGILSGVFPAAERLLRPYAAVFKTVPLASFIILCLIWMDHSRLTALISFLISFPVIYSNVLTGMKNTDPKLLEMARCYRIPFPAQLVYIRLPAIKPYLVSASGVAVGMAWKAGAAAEVIGMVNGSIGEKLYMAKVYFQNADLLAWTVVIVLLSVLCEKLFTSLIEAAFRRMERM